ncbi:exosortase/archaeosortase family protein [Haloferula rosea]|uniref:Exosortase/archaeosortase family protein n=1 Tax=Haloferula rosea TaxID=490093 RepID=A0A934VEZ9_9BACT|nr:exosortase/archaeosortase family protein [Haloferula rosea]MBK1827839.1 exosortase/archaeosortase family protein [Haloferula rosea]
MEERNSPRPQISQQPPPWTGVLIIGLMIAGFYFLIPGFGGQQHLSSPHWLKRSWNEENDFEHGILVPIICFALLAWKWGTLRTLASKVTAPQKSQWVGLIIAVLGSLFFVLAYRTGQARLAIGGLPMILWGSTWFLWGWPIARLTFFPLFLLWLAIPVPQFQHATYKLQMLSTKLAEIGCGWLGVETEVRGTQIFSVDSKWEPLKIDEGCGGIRSLMALILISSVWAYLAKMPLWKKLVLMLSAFPLAIIGNMFRLTSIFVIAEYGDPDFAKDTWHDWSGLVIFYPISLLLLLAVHSILEGGIPKLRKLKQTTVTVTEPTTTSNT